MITFKKGTYNKEELNTLRDALYEASRNIECNSLCETCPNRKPCEDILRTVQYLTNLISKRND